MEHSPRNRFMTRAAVSSEPPVATSLPDTRHLAASSLADVLTRMDCAMSMTCIPDLLADGPECPDDGTAGPNLFLASLDQTEDGAPINVLRATSRTRMAQGRLIALRGRTVRARTLRPSGAAALASHEALADLRRIRANLYRPGTDQSETETRPSLPLRVATHAIGLSLIATALPVGAAMMTYTVLKGEDLRLTARLTTLTGLALAVLTGNPELAQMIGV